MLTVTMIGAAVAFWRGTAVNDAITSQDRAAFDQLAKRCHFTATDTIGRIREMQLCVLAEIPRGIIEHGSPREPGDVLKAGRGECYDRARVLEKFLGIAGFRTRHVYLFEASRHGVAGLALKGLASHALVDVQTEQGWMSVGTNVAFLGITTNGDIVASARVKKRSNMQWAYSPPSDLPSQANIAIYGLWSRHGRFFPPYLPLPDISWRDFRYNFSRDR
ncbi:MAG TPA: hypothetical protein VJL28_08240 [Gemmatimonadaceae bacterium]|nr:hypothetical protein [Gemmatimonadaceae bacterium]